MQRNSSDAASAEINMDMQAGVTEWSQLSTDDARELVHAAQIILTGNQQAVRDLWNPWGVHLREKKRNRPMDMIPARGPQTRLILKWEGNSMQAK